MVTLDITTLTGDLITVTTSNSDEEQLDPNNLTRITYADGTVVEKTINGELTERNLV